MSNKCCPTDEGPANCQYQPTGEGMYMAGPINSTKGIVIISDIFGMHRNSQRYVDVLGKAGFLVIMPDFFGADAWLPQDMPPDRESEKWKRFWGICCDFDRHLPKARKAVAILRQMGCTSISSIGMCWGSRLAFDLAAEKLIDAAATAHPSILSPDAVKSALGKPICIMLSKDEGPFEEVEALAKTTPFKHSVYKRYSKLPHGFFGCRFDYDNCSKEELDELNEAIQTSVTFFNESLKE